MKTLATLCTLSFLVLGCGDDDRSGDADIVLDRDTGSGIDAGRPDTGTRPDTGGNVDSGVEACRQPVTDLRVLNMDPMAMGMLLPRCSAETGTCLSGCDASDMDCPAACYAADTTPGVNVGMDPAGMPIILDCEFCNNYQFEVCISESCDPSYGNFVCCREANGCTGASCPACMAELAAVQSCVMTANCNSQLLACFP